MAELPDQLRTYFDLTTEPVDVDEITAISHPFNGRPADPVDPRRSNAMTVDLETRPDQREEAPKRSRRTPIAITLAAAAAILLAIAAIAVRSDDSDDGPVVPATQVPPDQEGEQDVEQPEDGADVAAPTAPSTEEVIRAYESAVNARDLDAVMALWAEDGVYFDSPMAGHARGTTEIERIEKQYIDGGAPRDQIYWVTDLQVDGSVANMGHVWYWGGCESGTGHRVVVEDGLITEWDFGTAGLPCVSELLGQAAEMFDDDPAQVATLFTVDGQVVNHPFDNMVPIPGDDSDPIDDPAIGRSAVGEVFAALLPGPEAGASHELRNIEADGPEATFDLITGDGVRCSGFGDQRVVAEGGLIVLWDLGTDLGLVSCE